MRLAQPYQSLALSPSSFSVLPLSPSLCPFLSFPFEIRGVPGSPICIPNFCDRIRNISCREETIGTFLVLREIIKRRLTSGDKFRKREIRKRHFFSCNLDYIEQRVYR